MTDSQRLEIMKRVNMIQDRKLLKEVVNWWDNDYGNGNFSSLVNKIKRHLENCGAQEDQTTQETECSNSVHEGNTVQE